MMSRKEKEFVVCLDFRQDKLVQGNETHEMAITKQAKSPLVYSTTLLIKPRRAMENVYLSIHTLLFCK